MAMHDIWDQKLCPNRGIAWLKKAMPPIAWLCPQLLGYAPNCLAMPPTNKKQKVFTQCVCKYLTPHNDNYFYPLVFCNCIRNPILHLLHYAIRKNPNIQFV